MPYYPPPASGGTSTGGYNYYYIESSITLDVPVDFENICTTILTLDGILQVTGKATVL